MTTNASPTTCGPSSTSTFSITCGAVTLKQLVDDQKAKASGVAQVQDMRETLPKRERTTVPV